MKRGFLFGLSAIACLLLAICVDAMTTSINVDIVVTHAVGSALTTYTIQNTTNSTWVPNMPYIAGQSFRRGDVIAANNCVQIRDAANHSPLPYQLDEIATRRENGDDGSIRHLVFSMLFPASSPQYSGTGIPANGTFQIEFVTTGAPCSPGTTHQTLSSLCATHDLKLHLTDVRNQDGTLRDSGDAAFDTCAASGNTGRDAPRHLAIGAVRDLYLVSGPLVYTSGDQDPLLYIQCYLDVTTRSDGVSLGPVRHVCRVDNSWMNVAAGSSGNAGAPGPAGFPNDPQAISYRPQLLDGSTNVLDWSWWDGSVNSSNNPVVTSGNPDVGCSRDLNMNGNWNIPSSTGANAWYYGMAMLYSTSGTPPAGMINNQLYFVYPMGEQFTSPNLGTNNTNIITLSQVPFVCSNYDVVPTTQGSGTQTFSWRLWHTHWQSWYTLDPTGLENWAAGGSRSTSPLLPQFTSSEQMYWKQTGTIPPLRLTTPASSVGDPTGYGGLWSYPYYEPMGRSLVIGGSGVGGRPDLGIVSEYGSQAWLLQDVMHWQRARVYSLQGVNYPDATMLNEVTGRVPVLNNGPPGADHAGTGGSYPQLGSPVPGVQAIEGNIYNNVRMTLLNVPVSTGSVTSNYFGGIWGQGIGFRNDHMPSFWNMMYVVFGSRHYLDQMYFLGNRSHYQMNPGPGLSGGLNAGAQDDTVSGVHYYGLFYGQVEPRATYWAYRDQMLPAFLGGDGNPEREYFNDKITETYWYSQAWLSQLDGTSSNLATGMTGPTLVGAGFAAQSFMDTYAGLTAWMAYAMGRDQIGDVYIRRLVNLISEHCTDQPGDVPSYYCASYAYEPSIHDTGLVSTYPSNIGAAYNGSDGFDWGSESTVAQFTAGSPNVIYNEGNPLLLMSNGDKVKYTNCVSSSGSTYFCGFAGVGAASAIDQLRTDTWYTITNVNASTWTFQIVDPSIGVPFPNFSQNGNPFTGTAPMKIRYYTAPSTGYSTPGYMEYIQALIYGFTDIGYASQMAPAINMINTRGVLDPTFATYTGEITTWLNWDPNVVVP